MMPLTHMIRSSARSIFHSRCGQVVCPHLLCGGRALPATPADGRVSCCLLQPLSPRVAQLCGLCQLVSVLPIDKQVLLLLSIAVHLVKGVVCRQVVAVTAGDLLSRERMHHR